MAPRASVGVSVFPYSSRLCCSRPRSQLTSLGAGSSRPRLVGSPGGAGIVGLPGDDLPHAALGTRVVACVAGNQVHVDVEHALSAGPPDIDTDVVAVGPELLLQVLPRGEQELHAGRHLVGRQLEEVGAVTEGNDQAVAAADREAVARTVSQLIAARHAARSAEEAGVVGVSHVTA